MAYVKHWSITAETTGMVVVDEETSFVLTDALLNSELEISVEKNETCPQLRRISAEQTRRKPVYFYLAIDRRIRMSQRMRKKREWKTNLSTRDDSSVNVES